MKKFALMLAASVAAVSAMAATSASAAVVNVLQNGSFEQGADGLTGWTLGGGEAPNSAGSFPPVVIAYNQASGYPTGAFGEAIPTDTAGGASPDAAGGHGLYFVSDFANPQTLSQSVSLTAGQSYTLGFDLYEPLNGSKNANGATFTASFNGVQFASINAGGAGQVQTWLNMTGPTFIATSTGTFQFDFTADGDPAKDFVLDRVYLIQTSTLPGVPEPASWALMITGLGLVGATLRSRRAMQATAA